MLRIDASLKARGEVTDMRLARHGDFPGHGNRPQKVASWLVGG